MRQVRDLHNFPVLFTQYCALLATCHHEFISHDCAVHGVLCATAFTWWRWESRLRGENAEGKKFYSDEWVPYTGTRKEFLDDLFTAIKDQYLYHRWRHLMIRHAIKLHESRKDGVTATRGGA